MIWEFFITVISIGLFALLYYLIDQRNDLTSVRSSIFLVKTVYGLLSFPFMIFVIPQLTVLLARTRETKYNQYGRCVPFLPSLIEARRKQEELEAKKRQRKLERERLKQERKDRNKKGLVESEVEEDTKEIEDVDLDDFFNNEEVVLLGDDFFEDEIGPNPQIVAVQPDNRLPY